MNLMDAVKSHLERFIRQYKIEIDEAKENSEKIKVIAKFIHLCDMLHPFPDANIRTFAMLICNRLLIENGFFVVIFENPNRFDGYSITQLSLEIMKGMKRASEISGRLFQWNDELIAFEKSVQVEKELYDTEKRIRTTLWEVTGGCKITLDNKIIKVPREVAKQWEVINLAKHGVIQVEEALKRVQAIGKNAAENVSLFRKKTTQDYYDSFKEQKGNQREFKR